MAKTGQLYRVPLTDDARENAKPAQFVFLSNDSDEVIGFIVEVDKETNELEICLFGSSKNVRDAALIIEEEMPDVDVYILLERAMNKNPEMRDEWLRMTNETLELDPMVGAGYPEGTIVH